MAKNRIKEYRKQRGLTLAALAAEAGTTKQNIQRYENGIIDNIPRARIERLSSLLGVTPTELMGWDNEAGGAPRRLPLLGAIACGTPIFASEERGEYLPTLSGIEADFCLTARGDSMTGARIFDGDTVFIKSQSSVDNGEIAAVIIGDEATLKRVYFDGAEKKLVLAAENPAFAPMVFVGEELQEVRIIGRAVAFQSKL